MLKVLNVKVEDLNNKGCTNGNYLDVEIKYYQDGFLSKGYLEGKTCRCGNGCSNTWRIYQNIKGENIPLTELVFIDKEDLMDFLKS